MNPNWFIICIYGWNQEHFVFSYILFPRLCRSVFPFFSHCWSCDTHLLLLLRSYSHSLHGSLQSWLVTETRLTCLSLSCHLVERQQEGETLSPCGLESLGDTMDSTFYYVPWSGSQRGWSSLSWHNLEIKEPINPLVSFEAYNLFSDISVPCLADLQTLLLNCV